MDNNEEIVLTLESKADQAVDQPVVQEKKDIQPAKLDTSMLTEADQKMVDEFSEKIDITQTDIIMSYGSDAQKKVADFSSNALNDVKTKDLGQIGDMISDLVVELKGFEIDNQEKGIKSWFKKSANKVQGLKAKYDKAEVNVNKICDLLEGHQIQLLKDIALLDELYDKNEINKKELTMYILAGQKKLKYAQEVELPKLVATAQETGLTEDSQRANDYANLINRFEKKLHDLELTRMISIQMAPQIRLIQNNDTLMAEKIQSTLVNTIPLWKSQMVIALGLSHSQEAIEAEKAVDAMTNELLKKNAEALKQGTIATAEASEKGIVELETLQFTNKSLIETLDEVLKIQTEGRERRAAAEVELRKLETELRNKLLEVKNLH
ncbi:MAG: toxic anion resistance protein [Erysipelotrichaceae bacterium]|nr:toxic anion resistance protein [Erysipelotrichaceae bacterium]MBO4537442.1 toxic anion resistance protein [Erysipelotrichaceae bacterium]MBR5049022.1 toxic anion resistance protein [Erysipelotrichaceae bacterium]